jgi:hypothetical protein
VRSKPPTELAEVFGACRLHCVGQLAGRKPQILVVFEHSLGQRFGAGLVGHRGQQQALLEREVDELVSCQEPNKPTRGRQHVSLLSLGQLTGNDERNVMITRQRG